MAAKCPNGCTDTKFITTAHVAQTWKVDADGNFLEEISTDDTTHAPDPGNEWTCTKCGAVANHE
jgi:hypothetical protein